MLAPAVATKVRPIKAWLSTGGKPQILGSFFFRWVVFIFDRVVETNLEAMDQPVHTTNRDEKSGCSLVKLDCPVAFVIYIEPWDSLNRTSLFHQPFRNRAAEIGRRRALEAKMFNLLTGKSALDAQMFLMGR